MLGEWWFWGIAACVVVLFFLRKPIQFTAQSWFNFLTMKNDFEEHFLRAPIRSERRILWSFGGLAYAVFRLNHHPNDKWNQFRLDMALDQCRYQVDMYSREDERRSDVILAWLNDKYRVAASYLKTQYIAEDPAGGVNVAQNIWLIDYREHYLEIFGRDASRLTENVLAELFVFRAWTTQFAFRIASHDANHDALISETINGCKYQGIKIFEKTHGFSIEEVLECNFMDLIEDRWYTYDDVVVSSPKEIPASEICGELLRLANIADGFVAFSETVH